MDIDGLLKVMRPWRVPMNTEREAQEDIARRLALTGLDWSREVVLDGANRIDFVCEGFGLEVKIDGAKRSVYRQLERYSGFSQLRGLILLTSRPWSASLADINGMPFRVLSLSRGWL